MMLELMRRALEAVQAEHASVNGVHSSKGCHGCFTFNEFRKYVLEQSASYPGSEVLVSSALNGKTRFAIWVSDPLTKEKWKTLCKYVALLEPEAIHPDGASVEQPSTEPRK